MDELDLIRSFRADVPPPGGAATARAERAWRRDRPRRPRWAPRLVVAGAVVAAGIVALFVLPGQRDGGIGTADATAAQTLRRAAGAQSGGLARPLGAGEFWYLRARNATIIGGDEGRFTAIQPELREEWVAIDGTRRVRVRPIGPLRFPGPRDRERWEAAGRPPLASGPADYHFPAPRKGPFYLGDQPLSYAELLALPRDAESLYGRLRAAAVDCECGHSVDSETFVIVGDTLRSIPIPDDLRAAFLRAAALIPGIKLVAREHDVAGRPGLAVAYDYARHRDALVFDRDSYSLLGETDRLLARDDLVDGTPGQLIGGSAYIESGVVTSQAARP
jgi:hypothetical protein